MFAYWFSAIFLWIIFLVGSSCSFIIAYMTCFLAIYFSLSKITFLMSIKYVVILFLFFFWKKSMICRKLNFLVENSLYYFSYNLWHLIYVWFQDSERVVSREEGIALAKELGCLFLECSAKTRENVEQCFEELALKVILIAFIHLQCTIFDIFDN